jgi:uncharacterized membrane protein SirB2
VGVREHQDRQLRLPAADVRDGRAPHVSVLRRQRGAGYTPWRPLWLLALRSGAGAVHLGSNSSHAYAWSWIADVPLLVLTSICAGALVADGASPACCIVLFLGLAWLPIAFALYSAQSIGYLLTGVYALGRAPAHALFVGFFGSVLVAMVTRVTQGHSGRALVMPKVAWFAFGAIQLVAAMRIGAEFAAIPCAGRRWRRSAGWWHSLRGWRASAGSPCRRAWMGSQADAMIEFYPQIKQFHIFVALLSGSVFALRGAFAIGGARWPNALPVKWMSYAIDTALLTAALMLLTILPGAVFANGWLATKLVLLVVYVVLGVLALRRAKTQRSRVLFYAAALCTYVAIYSIARAHQPLGFYTWWFG